MTLHTLDDIISFELLRAGPEADIAAAIVRRAAPNSGIAARDIHVWHGPDTRSFLWSFYGDKGWNNIECIGDTYEERMKSGVTQLATAILWEVAHN